MNIESKSEKENGYNVINLRCTCGCNLITFYKIDCGIDCNGKDCCEYEIEFWNRVKNGGKWFKFKQKIKTIFGFIFKNGTILDSIVLDSKQIDELIIALQQIRQAKGL
jgi:hypothetical protein